MPCMELFDKQPEDFRNDIIEKNSLVVTLEAGSVISWQNYIKFIGRHRKIIGFSMLFLDSPILVMFFRFFISFF